MYPHRPLWIRAAVAPTRVTMYVHSEGHEVGIPSRGCRGTQSPCWSAKKGSLGNFLGSHLPLLFPGPPQAARDTKCLRPTCLFFAAWATARPAQNRGHVSKVPAELRFAQLSDLATYQEGGQEHQYQQPAPQSIYEQPQVQYPQEEMPPPLQ